MKKADWKYLVDTLLFLSVAGIVLIGLLLAFVIAEGPVKDESRKVLLGLHRHQWSALHLYFSLAFTGLLIVHLILAWDWIRARARSIFKERWRGMLVLTAAAALLIPLIFLIMMPKSPPVFREYGTHAGDGRRPARLVTGAENAPGETPRVDPKSSGIPPAASAASPSSIQAAPVQPEESHTRGRLEETAPGVLITGQMTLRDLENESGIAAERILERLGLPPSTPRNETLGRLRRSLGFSMQDLREALEELLSRKRP